MKKILTILAIVFVFSACSEDHDDNITPTPSQVNVSFNFTHDWDNTLINSSNLTTEIVTNEHGEEISMTRIRYLVSRLELVNNQGESYLFDGYKFTDLSDEASYNFTPDNNSIPPGTYTLKFIWGFNETDNVDGAYADLNSASWNWPEMLGGGYHFLQFDGMYNVNTTAPAPFNYHNGTARVSTGVFEQNFAEIDLPTEIVITNNAVIEVKMNIAEFFKNPNTWDLNVLDTPLMPNYTAQKMMQENVSTVFSVGTVTQ
ncbi:MbnP family protein [Hanstruepera marina]|uniref:MbnP family protein n=1 Tax=Hanstruepera marina TaxID=2873265 RepID=UPI001CA5FC81|nr:MbnP family protein [Hanstruepera marina]